MNTLLQEPILEVDKFLLPHLVLDPELPLPVLRGAALVLPLLPQVSQQRTSVLSVLYTKPVFKKSLFWQILATAMSKTTKLLTNLSNM